MAPSRVCEREHGRKNSRTQSPYRPLPLIQLMIPQLFITALVNVLPTSPNVAETVVVQFPYMVEIGGALTQCSGLGSDADTPPPGAAAAVSAEPAFGKTTTVPTVSSKDPFRERMRMSELLSGWSSNNSKESMPCQIVGVHFSRLSCAQLVISDTGQYAGSPISSPNREAAAADVDEASASSACRPSTPAASMSPHNTKT